MLLLSLLRDYLSRNIIMVTVKWSITFRKLSNTGIVCDINSLAPGRFQRNFRKVIFQLILVIDG